MPSKVSRRQALTALAIGVVVPSALAACGSKVSKPTEQSAAPTAASVTYKPTNAAADVSPVDKIGVEVKDGWFQRVALINPEGKAVAGSLNRDRTEFTVTEPLGYGLEYTW